MSRELVLGPLAFLYSVYVLWSRYGFASDSAVTASVLGHLGPLVMLQAGAGTF